MTYQADLVDAGGPASPNYHKELALRLMRERPQFAGKLLIDGSWDWQVVDELVPQPGDVLFRKSRYSGFVATGLDNYLRENDIRYLFFTGIATNVCVESTARDAFFGEYWPILVEDAMNHTGPDFLPPGDLVEFREHLWLGYRGCRRRDRIQSGPRPIGPVTLQRLRKPWQAGNVDSSLALTTCSGLDLAI